MKNGFKNFLRYVVTTWRSIRRKSLHKQFARSKAYFATKKSAGAFRNFIRHVPRKLLITTGAALAVVLVLTIVLVTTAGPQDVASQGTDTAYTQGSPTPDPSQIQDPSLDPSASPTPPSIDPAITTIKEGMDAPVVADIQQRLMDLNYMDDDEPTMHYGPATKTAVTLFQRQNGLTTDGCMGGETYQLLNSSSAQKYLVSKGQDGTDIEEMQKRLRELGYMSKATTHFGTDTEAAVKKFQQLNGLTADGKVGGDTREMLYSDEAKPNFITKGESSEKIKSYQVRLQKLGYLTSTPDGTYGKSTIDAVKKFQDKNGLIADGYLGPETIALLNSSKADGNDALALGAKGDSVTNVQNRLKALNYLKSVTGYYGSTTVSAVKAFQKRNGLGQDGKVGSRTLSVLMSSKAKKAAASSGNNTGGNTPTPTTGSDPGDPDGSSSTGVDKFIEVAKTRLGCRYVSGGKGPNTFDCSGFVYWCLNQAGVRQSYMTSATWQKCTKYERIENFSDLKRGDVISFRGHVGICLGGGQMIDAGSSKGNVHYSNLNTSYWKTHFVCGFRIF